MRAQIRVIMALTATSSLGGCCSIAQGMSALFCGPRSDPFLERNRETPGLALETFLGAISRDDVSTIYESLSEDLKERLGITEFEFAAAWERLKAETPGIHLADQAERSEPRIDDAGVSFELRLPLTRIEVHFRRYDFWAVKTLEEGAPKPIQDSGYRPFSSMARMEEDPDRSPVRVEVPGPPFPGVGLDEVVEVRISREWLVDGLHGLE